jgi:hypothetical protein
MEQQLRLVAARRINSGEEIFVCYTGIRFEHMQPPFLAHGTAAPPSGGVEN